MSIKCKNYHEGLLNNQALGLLGSQKKVQSIKNTDCLEGLNTQSERNIFLVTFLAFLLKCY